VIAATQAIAFDETLNSWQMLQAELEYRYQQLMFVASLT
jgi:hypothetical protein